MNRIKLDRDVEERIVSKRGQWADRRSSGWEKPCARQRRCNGPRAQARRALRTRLRSGRVAQARDLRPHPFGDGVKFAVCRVAALSRIDPARRCGAAAPKSIPWCGSPAKVRSGPCRSDHRWSSRIDRWLSVMDGVAIVVSETTARRVSVFRHGPAPDAPGKFRSPASASKRRCKAARRRPLSVAKTCQPSSPPPLTDVTTSGILQPLAVSARRPPCLRVAPTAALMAPRFASTQNTLTVVSSMSSSRSSLTVVSTTVVSTHFASQVARADLTVGWTASLYAPLNNARFWQFARRRFALSKSKLRLASENLPSVSPRPFPPAWPTTTR